MVTKSDVIPFLLTLCFHAFSTIRPAIPSSSNILSFIISLICGARLSLLTLFFSPHHLFHSAVFPTPSLLIFSLLFLQVHSLFLNFRCLALLRCFNKFSIAALFCILSSLVLVISFHSFPHSHFNDPQRRIICSGYHENERLEKKGTGVIILREPMENERSDPAFPFFPPSFVSLMRVEMESDYLSSTQ